VIWIMTLLTSPAFVIPVIFTVLTIINIVYYSHIRDSLQFQERQVKEHIGRETVLDLKFTNLSYNEAHNVELGIFLGAMLAFTLGFYPLISHLIALELVLICTGLNLTGPLENRNIPPEAFIYTLRSNPWYFLIFFVSTYGIGIAFYLPA